MAIIYSFYSITSLFFFILILRRFLPYEKREKICSICLAISVTWISLLVLYHLDKFNNVLFIAILMGMTILGIFYTLERKVKKELTFFRLPFLLTLILFFYYLITLENLFKESVFVLALWIFFIIIYHYRENPGFRGYVDKIIECCKKW